MNAAIPPKVGSKRPMPPPPQLAKYANKKGERPKQGGRTKGVPNHTTTDLRRMILNALALAGGEKYLLEQSLRNPSVFCTLVGKVLPLQVTGDPDGEPIRAQVEVTFIEPE